jgi:hypothetical protein
VDKSDYYEILQVDSGASQEEIRAAYKRLAFLYHPDLSAGADSTLQMQLLNEAYEILGYPEKRALYDSEKNVQQSIIIVEESPDDSQEKVHSSSRRSSRFIRLALRLSGWVSDPLKTLFRVAILMFLIFLWAMFIGQINIIVVFALIIFAVWLILSLILRMNYARTEEN